MNDPARRVRLDAVADMTRLTVADCGRWPYYRIRPSDREWTPFVGTVAESDVRSGTVVLMDPAKVLAWVLADLTGVDWTGVWDSVATALDTLRLAATACPSDPVELCRTVDALVRRLDSGETWPVAPAGYLPISPPRSKENA